VNEVSRWINKLFLLSFLLLAGNSVADDGCENGLELQHGFSSGASWSTCAVVNDLHGLELKHLRYRAPGDVARSVLSQLHPAQLLLHYHNASDPVAQFGVTIRGDKGLGANSVLSYDELTCSGEILPVQSMENILCTTEINTGVLAKYSERRAVHGARWQIEMASRRDSLVWTTSISLHEDGTITPDIRMSGAGKVIDAAASLVPATVLSSWRIVFALDGDSVDRVEEFDFVITEGIGDQRPMQVTNIEVETLRQVNRKAFRGWRIRDSDSGKGYYLDPANSGYAYNSRSLNWAQFDMAFTRTASCEQHALHNVAQDGQCGLSLDDFVNGEQLNDSVTLWHQQSRVWQPRREDWPAITTMSLGFDLLPFEWTASSPFDRGR